MSRGRREVKKKKKNKRRWNNARRNGEECGPSGAEREHEEDRMCVGDLLSLIICLFVRRICADACAAAAADHDKYT